MFAEGKIIQSNSDVKQVSYGDDAGLYVEFYWREVKNEAKSLAEGRPIFESKEYIKILAPGDKTKQWDRPVQKKSNGITPSDPERFSKQWAIFQRQDVQVTEGTPVTEWPQITRADAAMLKSMNIHTIEALAAISDANLGFIGGREYRDKAKAWIEKAKDGASVAQMALANQALQDQITALQNQINGLKSAGVPLQEAQTSPEPKKRGPKPKVNNEQISPTIDSASG